MERRHYQRIRSRAIEEANRGQPPKRDLTKPLAIGGAVLGVIGFIWFFVSRAQPEPDQPVAEEVDGIQGVNDGVPPGMREQDAEELMEKVILAATVEELLALVEHPEVSEARMREFYAEGQGNPLPMGGYISNIESMEINGILMYAGFVNSMFASNSLLPIVEGDDGEPSVSWEAIVGWMDPDWEEILESKPEEPTLVRVFAKVDDYFNYDYRDEEKWRCLKMVDRNLESPCYAYMDLTDEQFRNLKPSIDYSPITLEIKFLPGQTRLQAEVVKFSHLGWSGD